MITVTAFFDVKPDCRDKFIRLACDCARNSRREKGNLSYKVYAQRNNGSQFTFIEEWVNDAAIEMHSRAAHFQSFIAMTAPFLNSEPVIKQLTTVAFVG
jgi:quinol monooxygenase YgiN